MHIRHLAAALFVSVFVAGSLPLPSSYRHSAVGAFVAPTAEAKKLRERARSLLDRITGASMPEGIVKTNGRIEATQVDVAAKYPGRLVDITVEEGSEVKAGQVVGRVLSPEYEAQLRAAQSNVEKAKQSLAEAETLITQRTLFWRRPNPTSIAARNLSARRSSRNRPAPTQLRGLRGQRQGSDCAARPGGVRHQERAGRSRAHRVDPA
jgi:multidrug efflux pump subunit AcrA (membrane-fusion protein)